MNLSKVLLLVFVFVKFTKEEPLERFLPNLKSQVVKALFSSRDESALNSIRPGSQEFSIKLYSYLAKEGGNVIVSPMSLQMMLALTLAGARGLTANELITLLSLQDLADETIFLGHKRLIKVFQHPMLNLANRIFIERSAPVKEDYEKIAEEYFFTQVESLEFEKEPEESREHINSWVEKQTNEKIKDLLAPGTISADTRLVLVNAIHFKANWKTKFDKSNTRDQPFYLSSSETEQSKMMNSKSKFEFSHDNELEAKILRLDYEGEIFEMVVILPNDYNGLSRLESKLETITDIFERVNGTKFTTVDVYLPKFKIEITMELNKVLNAMGVTSIFSETSNLSGITDENLTVSKVVQKGFVEVYEEGTEAAVATAVIFKRSLPFEPEEPLEENFVADHPFLFFIVLKKYQLPVLCGRYAGN